MPKRTDLKTILVLGSGPIVIGQGCEFDYSGTQACKTLKSEGYRIVLVNSNPATIMTDPAFSDRTYIEPILPETVRKIIIREKELGTPIDAILPTLGGQTALNTACALFDNGTLTEFGVEMIGANRKVIHRAEDREQFKQIVEDLGLKMPKSKAVHSMEEALGFLGECGLPAIIRPAFTLGGTGGGIAYNLEEFREIVARGLAASIITQVQIDQSVIGWKEFELEVVRDKKDNCIIVCGIENIDPMGVHTGDSITVAPILTLTDKEYQAMRDAAFAIMRAVGVETGGSNVQFAVNPDPTPDPVTGHKPFEMVVVEMNPRVSRSSALASKATGFPIAKIAARLAVGYTLDELRNDITGTTSACFEPAIDYVVTKIPRWTFEKFPEADETLTTQMKSVGEVMAIGRTFKESFQKALRSLDVKRFGLGLDRNDKWLAAMRAVEHDQLILDISPGAAPGTGSSPTGLRTADGAPIEWPIPLDKLTRKLAVPCQGRMYYIRYAMKMGWSDARIGALTKIDPFFLDQIRELVEFEDVLCNYKKLEDVPADVLMEAKQLGYSDAQLANLYKGEISPPAILSVRGYRKSLGIEPVYKLVDTCAAEFEAVTPYYYSTYERGIGHQASGTSGGNASGRMTPAEDEIRITDKKKVIILGGGPNRIGQGIEFDYCCVHAAFAAKELGFESVMINSNPETVSTDYDTSDLLFFEPLTMEDVLNIVERLNGPSLQLPRRIIDVEPPAQVGNLKDRRQALVAALDQRGIGSIAICGSYESGFAEGADGFKYEFVSDDGRHWAAVFREGKDIVLDELYERPASDAIKDYVPEIYARAKTQLGLHNGINDSHDLRSVELLCVSKIEQHFADAQQPARPRDLVASVAIAAAHHRLGPIAIYDICTLSCEDGNGIGLYGVTIDGRSWEIDLVPSGGDYAVRIEPDALQTWRRHAESYDVSEVRPRVEQWLAQHGSPSSRGLVHGVIVQFGGQTPLNLAKGLVAAGVPLIGTSLDSIDLAEDRKRFDALLERLKINRPPAGTATSLEEAVKIAGGLGYPILVRPSYVLGGRGMEVCPDEKSLRHYITNALKVSDFEGAPVLIDKFLDAATEVDLDVVADWGNAKNADGTVAEPTALVSGLMEHIEHAGVHSGDSACAIPHHSLSRETVEEIKEIGRTLARELKVNGLMNVQLAVRHENVGTSGSGSSGGSVSVGAAGTTRDTIYILEVNPRASRTVPFVSKATHVPWPSIAAKVMMGKTLAELGAREFEPVDWVAVKESVFPFAKFPGVDVVLGPEMRSTGEVMGIDRSFPIAFAKSQLATGVRLPSGGGVFVSVRDVDKQIVIEPVRQLTKMGFTIYATMGTAEPLLAAGVKVQILQKVAAGARPNAIDMMTNGEIKLVINTPTRTGYQTDEGRIRAATVRLGVPMISTASAVGPAVRAIEALKAGDWNVHALQDYVRSDVGAPAAAEPKPRGAGRVAGRA